jgi:hypothetical protein
MSEAKNSDATTIRTETIDDISNPAILETEVDMINVQTANQNKFEQTKTAQTKSAPRLPWGQIKQKSATIYNKNLLFNLKNEAINLESSLSSSTSSSLTVDNLKQFHIKNAEEQHSLSETQKPGEYVMHLVMLSFIQLASNKFDQIISGDKREKLLKECLKKSEDKQLEQLVITMGNVAEQCLPSLLRSLLIWHEAQFSNLNYLKQHLNQVHKQQADAIQASNSKLTLKLKQQLIQAKL